MASTPLVEPPAGGSGPGCLLAEAAMLVEQAQSTVWAGQTGAQLVGVVDLCGRLKAMLDAVECGAVHELHTNPAAQQGLKDAGWAAVTDLVTHVDGTKPGTGRATVRLAAQLVEHPAVAAAHADGWLSTVKARIILTAVTRLPAASRPDATVALLQAARALGAADLEAVAARIRQLVDPDGVDAAEERALDRTERAAHLHRRLRLRFDQLGGGTGDLSGSAEDLTLLETVLGSLAAPTPAEPGCCGGNDVCEDLTCQARGHDGSDTRDHGMRMFDALIELARRHQSTSTLPTAHGGVPQVVVTVDLDDLRADLAEHTVPGTVVTGTGEDLDPGTARRMACDAEIIPAVLGTDSAVLDVGRRHRLVTAALWVALVLRDRHCAFPGCRRPPVMCHAHHIVHWINGGPTSLGNMVLLCGAHHRIIHSTPWEVRLRPDDRRPEFRPPGRHDWIRQRRRE